MKTDKKKPGSKRYAAVKYFAFATFFLFAASFGVVKAQAVKDDVSSLDEVMLLYLQARGGKVAVAGSANNGDTCQAIGVGTNTDIVIVSKTVSYNDITTTGATVVNPVSGDWYTENVVLETDSHTMASGTFFQLVTSSGGTFGSSTILLSTQVGNFSSSTVMDLNTRTTPFDNPGQYLGMRSTASSTQRAIISDGKSLLVRCTTAACKRTTDGSESGTGYLRVTAFLRRVQNFGFVND